MIIWIINQYCSIKDMRSRQRIFAKYLQKSNYEVYILCTISDKSEIEQYDYKILSNNIFLVHDKSINYIVVNLESKLLKNKIGRVFSSLIFQIRILKNTRKIPAPDLIINEFAGIFGGMFDGLKKKFNTKIVYDILDLWPESFVDLKYIKQNSIIAKILYFFEKKSYENADFIFFSVQGGKDYIVNKKWDINNGGKIDLNKIGYLNNSLDLGETLKEKKEYILDDKDLDRSEFKVVYIGAINIPNNVDIIVKTAYRAKYDKDILFLIYGIGNQLERLKKMVEDFNLYNIKFKGFLPYEYAANVVSRCDLAIWCFENLPLLKYGISNNKFFLYTASGKPIVSTIKTSYDLIEEYNCGKIVSEKPEDIYTEIVNFKNMDRSRYLTYCENSLEVALKFDYAKTIRVLLDKIEQLLERNSHETN